MTDFADAPTHNAIPDTFLWCILTRRHAFPPPRNETKVRVQYGPGRHDVLEVFESIDTCGLCGTVRTHWRDQTTNRGVYSTYEWPDGYEAPPGQKWDREYLWTVYRTRRPVTGRTRVVKR